MEAMDPLAAITHLASKAVLDQLHGVIRETVPDPRVLSDWQVNRIAQAVAAQAEEAARLERPRQRRREWMLLIVGLIAGALLSIPVGIWVNHIS
ncbi:hypothetical protein [Microbispora sp. GKU 823]|uniref:hypothetical protein n=1 Tax=Microbispora sp. GKU 823 TaxID=1652100 RepID=UPI0009A26068|nr:hypothetical protein [Microbispora sp. GKU 823]OPG12326.1 hypothetical protein B1L11_14935 [Microbispora sp. GKU 823]